MDIGCQYEVAEIQWVAKISVVDDVNSRTTFQQRPTCTRREKNLSRSKKGGGGRKKNVNFIAVAMKKIEEISMFFSMKMKLAVRSDRQISDLDF